MLNASVNIQERSSTLEESSFECHLLFSLQNWEDEFLRWNKSDYGGLEEIIVSQSAVWLPDILVENT